MSHLYYLVCVDTGQAFNLGKIVSIDDQGHPLPSHFGGWKEQDSRDWVDGLRLFRLLERFLIINRGKELRLVPELFLDRVDPEGYLTYFDSFEQPSESEISPEPDDDEDTAAIPLSVSEALSRLVSSRQLQIEEPDKRET
jgi:hypothetical protein